MARATSVRRTTRSRSRRCATPRPSSPRFAEVLLERTGPGHGGLGRELRRHAGGAVVAAGAPAAPAAQRHHRHRGGHGHRHAAAQPQRSGLACVRLLDDPDASVRDLCEHVRGPDFPTEAEIITPARRSARALRNRQRQHARPRRVHARGRQHRHHRAAAPGLPSKIVEQIAQQMRAKKLPMAGRPARRIRPRRDPIRLVMVPRSNRIDAEQLMGHLFATTDLERATAPTSTSSAWTARPQVKNLKTFLIEWLAFRTRHGARRLQAPPGQGRAPPAPARRPADRLPQPGRSDPHHPHRGRAEAGADRALRAERGPGRLHPRHQAEAAGAPGGNEDPRRAGRTGEGTREADRRTWARTPS
jgi:hypothetical protein